MRLAIVGLLVLGLGGMARAADYPESADGLKKLTEDVMVALGAGKTDQAKALVKTMLLPDHEKWFVKTFGDAKGKALAAGYTPLTQGFEDEVLKVFAAQLKQNRINVTAYKVESADDKAATGAQQKALAAMVQKTPLYGVRMVEPGKDAGFHLWSFVYVDGAFRLAGKMTMRD